MLTILLRELSSFSLNYAPNHTMLPWRYINVGKVNSVNSMYSQLLGKVTSLLCLLEPTADPYVRLDKCTYFHQARLDQRFEVIDEQLVSVCSKFAKSEFPVSNFSTSPLKPHLLTRGLTDVLIGKGIISQMTH